MAPRIIPALLVSITLALAACGAGAPASSSAGAAPASAAPLEKSTLEVAVSGVGTSSVPLYIAHDAGYFTNHGLTVNITTLGPPAANQALVSGSLDLYHGSASMITAHLAGADSIYVAAPTDRSPNVLFGKKGMTSFADLRGKTVALSGPGTTRDIFLHHSATQQGLEAGKDIKTLYVPNDPPALAAFLSGNADATLVAPPASTQLQSDGYPILVDYLKDGLKVIEPGIAVSRQFAQKNPNTIKAYLMAYLDGVKRAYEDPALAKQTESRVGKVTDQQVLDRDYQLGLQTWNKNLSVDPADIQLVLDALPDPKAKAAKPQEFYDNSFIEAVNRGYGSKLFPADVKQS